MTEMPKNGELMQTVSDLWMMRRDLISDGFDQALNYIKEHIPLTIHEIPSGTPCWTWTAPEKWSVREAYVEDLKGNRLIDLRDHPLHVISYSAPVDTTVTRDELLKHIHTQPNRPNAIPYEFKFYQRDWGFCMPHDWLQRVTEDTYRVFIDASFEKGSLKVGECTIPGERPESIALVAHLDHPAQANDDLSGVSVLTSIARHLLKQKNAYTYRLFFVPETIGSIALLSQKSELTDIIKSGLFLEMLGNNRRHSLQHTYHGNTRLDRIAVSVIRAHDPDFTEGAFRKIVSNDEAVFNGPGVNIPMISVSRAEPGIPHYPEYHTSDDTPEILSEERLTKSRDMVLDILKIIDADYVPKRTFKGPIFLSKYGLWVDWRTNHAMNKALELITFLLEGDLSVFDIAERVDVDFWEVKKYLDRFHEHGLITKSPPASE